jgi:hypothetical protein
MKDASCDPKPPVPLMSVSGAMMIGVAPTSRLLAHRAAARGFEPTIKWTCDSVLLFLSEAGISFTDKVIGGA